MKDDQGTFVILTPGFPANEDDTTCLPLQQSLIRKIKELCPDLKIVVLSFQYPWTKVPYTWNHISVIPFGGKNKGGLLHLLLWRRITRRLEKLQKENNITGILSFWCGECALIGKRFADKYYIPHYSWILGQDAKKNNKYVKLARLEASELLAISESAQQEFEMNYGIKPKLLIPGIELFDFISNHMNKAIDVMAAGSLIPLKQIDVFLSVIQKIKVQRPDIKVIICGDGPESDNLKKLVADFRLGDNVMFTGELSHNLVLQVMQKTKLLLHTSCTEGFSMVCLEALHAGSSVISFCRPMKELPANWHIVKNADDMVTLSIQLLGLPAVQPPGGVYSIDDTVKKVMHLFGYNFETELV